MPTGTEVNENQQKKYDTKELSFKGEQFGLRLIRLYRPLMINVFYIHYQGLAEMELSSGVPALNIYYQSIADTLYAHIKDVLNAVENVDGGG